MGKLTNHWLFGIVMTLAIVGCQNAHRLVATGGQHSVALYPDEATYLKVSHRAQQGGAGLLGEAEKDITAKQIDDQTTVKILSSDDNGAQVQITAGPMIGQAGFVARQNVD
jgi:hypothetical protein